MFVCVCVCVCVCFGEGGFCFVLISFHVHHAKLVHGFELTHTHSVRLVLIISNHRNILKLPVIT